MKTSQRPANDEDERGYDEKYRIAVPDAACAAKSAPVAMKIIGWGGKAGARLAVAMIFIVGATAEDEPPELSAAGL